MSSPKPDACAFKGDDVNALVLNILKRCKEEAMENKLNVPIEEVEKRVAFYTNIPPEELLLLHKNNDANQEIFMNLTLRSKINKCLNTSYAQELTPQYKDVYESLIYRHLPEFIQFKMNMTSMGYKFKKLADGRMLLVEDQKIAFERFLCLSNLKKIWGSDVSVYYIDQRVISQGWSLQKPSICTEPASDSFEEFVLFHVITKSGFLTSLFCHQVTDKDFKKWIIDNVLPLLQPSSVIVMDTNPFHGTLKENIITRYHSKAEMLKWLNAHNVPYGKMNKAQLFDLIQKYPNKVKDFDIDRILKALGHKVIHLPSHLQDVLPTEFMWKHIIQMNQKAASRKPWHWKLVKAQIMDWVSALPYSQWAEFELQSQQLVHDLLRIDEETEKYLDQYKFDIHE